MINKRLFNIIFISIALYALHIRLPSILTHFKFQDQKAPDFSIKMLSGETFLLSLQSKKVVVVFWATWCGPCEVELKRINKMILNKEIFSNDVIAISSNEDEKLIRETIKKENYLFNVGIDANGNISRAFKVTTTPTVVFIDDKQIINWMTAGISPTLQFRIDSFIK